MLAKNFLMHYKSVIMKCQKYTLVRKVMNAKDFHISFVDNETFQIPTDNRIQEIEQVKEVNCQITVLVSTISYHLLIEQLWFTLSFSALPFSSTNSKTWHWRTASDSFQEHITLKNNIIQQEWKVRVRHQQAETK